MGSYFLRGNNTWKAYKIVSDMYQAFKNNSNYYRYLNYHQYYKTLKTCKFFPQIAKNLAKAFLFFGTASYDWKLTRERFLL